MEFLKIHRSKSQVRADGSPYAVPLYVTKTKRMGNTLSEEAISTKRPILVTGAHDSGKSKWVERLHEHAGEIWGTKSKTAPLYLDTLRPLVAWSDEPDLEKWWEGKRLEEEKTDINNARAPWKSIKQYARAEALPDYCKDTGAVLFIDDAHKLAGRKLQIARKCVISSRLFVMAASEEQRLPPNLRTVVMRRDPQIFRLNSEVSYDATNLFMWAFLV
ncbi:MAG: hypothetical protein WBM66_01625, partial [Thiothrix litoralis]